MNKDKLYQYFSDDHVQNSWLLIMAYDRETAWKNAVKELKNNDNEDSFECYLRLKKKGNVKKVIVNY